MKERNKMARFYLSKGNIFEDIKISTERPLKLMKMRDATVMWTNVEIDVDVWYLERFIPILRQPPGTCMLVDVEEIGENEVKIIVRDRDVKCEVRLF
jgi:hypothetical protein